MTHTLNAPRVFSLLEAPEDTLAFLDELRRLVATPDLRVRIDLKDVATISPEVVAAFVAVMSSTPMSTLCQLTCQGTKSADCCCTISGSSNPQDSALLLRLRRSRNRAAAAGTVRCEYSGQRVEGQAAKTIIEFGLGSLGRTERKHVPAYNVFTEAMANTFEHAGKSARGVDRWWAAVCYDARRKVTCFTTVDTGVGILRSFNLQQHAEAWREGPRLAVPDQGKILRML